MKLRIKEREISAVIITLAVIVVIVLGALQYRWSNQVSEATSIRLADSLQMSMINWHLDFFRVFSEVCIALRVDPESSTSDDWNQYARRYVDWKRTTANPGLVAGLYILRLGEAPSAQVLRLAPSGQRFEPSEWPANFGELREELQQADVKADAAGTAGAPAGANPAAAPDASLGFADRFYSGGPLAGWQFEPRIPALVRPLGPDSSDASNRSASARNSADWIVIALDRNDVQNNILPALAQRYFRGTEGLDYQVAVTAGGNGAGPLYSSDAGFGKTEIADADGNMNIFGRLPGNGQESTIRIFQTPSQESGPAASVAVTWFPVLRGSGPGGDWRLIVRHRRGGALGAFIADSRRRDLAIGFGVLFLLVISMAILIYTSTRAQRLAKLQMDFVTAVSHELRTPLTVISSAAENIAHGVVEGKSQLEQYGSVIGAQARKLFEMVEQILFFAAIREGQQRYSLRPLEVPEILDSALTSTAGLIRTAMFHVEQNVDPNLPQVVGDLPALSQCVQNLITNALKYGSEQRWIGIQARLAEHGLTGKEIQISVADRGIGIAPEELRHIFEPFYRSPSVMAAQIHGTGLGLPLAKSIMESMHGQVTVKSSPGRGSTFTLHLPCAEHAARPVEAKTTEAVPS
ncbi:MAG TPA: HAMP domain-containing sensor histidine kinase [Verrucomicrobiae bacterium]|jgi:signal transduction histidine kinase|nr:HAMP domain-containing sensor histidine kinase [Verrucomicrobiae bacterium]